MKRGKMCILLVLVAVALSLTIMPAIANAVDISVGTITRIGLNPGGGGTTDGVKVFVDDEADTYWQGSRAFFLSDTLGKSGLATLLTGYSLGKTFWLRIADETTGSLISIIYIND